MPRLWFSKQPFANMGILVFQVEDLETFVYATGWLINQRVVVTSAHTFFVKNSKTDAVQNAKPMIFFHQMHESRKSRNEGYAVRRFKVS